MALLAHRLNSGCVAPRMHRATQRPCVVVRSATAPAQTAAAPAEAKNREPSNSPVVSLTSDEYDEFIASNELVLVDYYTE